MARRHRLGDGLGVVTLRAATLFAETAGARRFRTKDAYARFGVSPQSI